MMIWATMTPEFLLKSTGTFLSPMIVLLSILPLRNSPILYITGISYNRLFVFHRWLGYIVFIVSVIHTIFYAVNLSRPILQNDPLIFLDFFIPFPARTFGTLSMLTLTLLVITSIGSIRRRHYNLFRYSHTLVYPFYAFVGAHQGHFIPYAIALGIILLIDYIMFVSLSLCTRWKCYTETPNDTFVKLIIPRGKRLHRYEVGQHMYINIPGISSTEWHPFTIVSAPHEPNLEFGIRALGDWSTKLVQYSRTHPICDVRLYGPYGRAPYDLTRYHDIVLVSAGIGVTPMISILRDIYQLKREDCHIRTVTFIWLIKDLDTYDLYANTLNHAINLSNSYWNSPQLYPRIYVKNIDPRKARVRDPTQQVFRIKPKILDMFMEVCTHHKDRYPIVHQNALPGLIRESDPDIRLRRVALVSCGGNRLTRDIWDTARACTDRTYQVDYYHDSFEY